MELRLCVSVDRLRSDSGDLVLARFTQPLKLLAASALAGLFIVRFATHFLAKPTSLAEFAEAAHRFLNGFTGTNP
jgi:hypothetical protein